MKPPVRYASSLGSPEADKAETLAHLEGVLSEVLATVACDTDYAIRAVHAKSRGFLEATLTVLSGLPPDYAEGLFAAPGDHPAILRFSTNPGDVLDDSVSLPRGVALKVLDVEGERLEGSEGGSTQDFLLVNGPAFAASSARAFGANLPMLAKTTDRATLRTLGGAANVRPLGETYWTQPAFRHGDVAAEYQLVPVSPALTRRTGETVSATGRPDAIREEMNGATPEGPMAWELRAQLCRDVGEMPIEDPSVPWDEGLSPFVTVARLTAGPQPTGTEARAGVVDEGLRFSPWTGLAAHRPLGAINRVRKPTYDLSIAYRARVNGCPVHEPASAALPR